MAAHQRQGRRRALSLLAAHRSLLPARPAEHVQPPQQRPAAGCPAGPVPSPDRCLTFLPSISLLPTTSAWIVVEGNVYDVTEFAPTHPGAPGPPACSALQGAPAFSSGMVLLPARIGTRVRQAEQLGELGWLYTPNPQPAGLLKPAPTASLHRQPHATHTHSAAHSQSLARPGPCAAGGANRIYAIAGTDATERFMRQHGKPSMQVRSAY